MLDRKGLIGLGGAAFGGFQQGAARGLAQGHFRRGVGHVRVEGGRCLVSKGGLIGHRAALLRPGGPPLT